MRRLRGRGLRKSSSQACVMRPCMSGEIREMFQSKIQYLTCLYWTQLYIYTVFICCRFKRKTEAHAIFLFFCLLFAHRTNGSLSFVRLFTKKQKEVIRLQMD
jgi:hypothetical protein